MRALQGWGIFLVVCERSETTLNAGICVIDRDDPPPNPVAVFDVDTNEQYQLTLPDQLRDVNYGVEFNCVAV